MKRCLVTGATGFIGRALTKRLLSYGYEVDEFSSHYGDIADEACFRDMDCSHFAHVFHLAAKTFVPASWEDPSGFYRVNVNGTLNVLELCRKYGLRLTYVSAYIYGTPTHLPIRECDKVQPNNPYAHSKYLAEQLCEFYAKEYGLNIAILRPFNVYGLGQAERFLIPSIIRQALFEDTICVQDLNPKRDYVYIEDVVDALQKTVNFQNGFAVYNIGSGYSVSVDEVVRTVSKIIGVHKPIVSQSMVRPNELNDIIADVTKAKRDLEWAPNYSLIKGLTDMLGSITKTQK
jgi:nucleoside-diphosphate-sugar epimerase